MVTVFHMVTVQTALHHVNFVYMNSHSGIFLQQRKKHLGAVEARRAHNPEVVRSKRIDASCFLFLFCFLAHLIIISGFASAQLDHCVLGSSLLFSKKAQWKPGEASRL
ncbi:hypothetical protein GGR56DRAFT_641950 [Xylariaceae sp. FL0804]|nr:hypothetical protein GGR56DRAFT_641950 [Xylariaceae sp. FL0804]